MQKYSVLVCFNFTTSWAVGRSTLIHPDSSCAHYFGNFPPFCLSSLRPFVTFSGLLWRARLLRKDGGKQQQQGARPENKGAKSAAKGWCGAPGVGWFDFQKCLIFAPGFSIILFCIEKDLEVFKLKNFLDAKWPVLLYKIMNLGNFAI